MFKFSMKFNFGVPQREGQSGERGKENGYRLYNDISHEECRINLEKCHYVVPKWKEGQKRCIT